MILKRRTVMASAPLLASALLGLAVFTIKTSSAQEQAVTSQSSRARSMRQEKNRNDTREFARRGDIRRLPPLLKARLIEIAARPHSFLPITAFSEADDPSQLFQYYLLDTNNFQ